MLQRIIDFSLKNKFIVLLGTIVLVLGGVYALKNIPLDAIPDQSDVQVIVYTEWPGQAPQIVQDQVTYPLTTNMLSVPKAKVVRGYSFYGYSFVYIIFEDSHPRRLLCPATWIGIFADARTRGHADTADTEVDRSSRCNVSRFWSPRRLTELTLWSCKSRSSREEQACRAAKGLKVGLLTID